MARTKPSVRIHIDVPDHDRTSEVWGELEGRAMLVEIWRLGVLKYAGKNGNRLPLTQFDRMQICCTTDAAAADSSLLALCKRLKYTVRVYPNRWVVTVRNFARAQGFQGKELGVDVLGRLKTTSPSYSYSYSQSESEEGSKKDAPPSPPPKPDFKLTPPAPAKAPKKASQPHKDDRVVAAWPGIREAFQTHGRPLSESLRPDRARCILARIEEGASSADLVAAVHGYVDFHGGLEPQPDRNGGEFNPGQFFRVETIFKADGFSDRVDRGAGGSDGDTGGGGSIGRMMARAGVQ